MTTIERLEEILNEKDEQLEAAQKELSELKDAEAWAWTKHRVLEDDGNLPVPRLELRWHQASDNGLVQEWDYTLVYRHFDHTLVGIPMGHTRITGGNGNPPVYGLTINTPFRDGVNICHDSKETGIPAFAIVGTFAVSVFFDKEKLCSQTPYNKQSTQ